MVQKVILKKSSVPSKVPLVGDLEYGELALNYADGLLYYKNSSNAIVALQSGGGGGGGSFTFSSTPPITASSGDQWVDATTGIKYTYLDDGTSSQWVDLEADIQHDYLVTTEPSSSSGAYSNSYSMSGTTTNNTETEIFIGGVSGNRIPVPTNTTIYYIIDIVAKRTDAAGEYAAFTLKSVAANESGTVSDIGSVYETVITRTDANITVDCRANNTTKTIDVFVTGLTGKTFSWKATVNQTEI